VGDARTLLVDAGADPIEGAAVLATAEGLGARPVTLVLTHGHWDHVRGLAGMAPVDLLVHEDAWPSARDQLAVTRRAPGAVIAAEPTVTAIDPQRPIDLGGVTVTVIETPGHAPGSVCLHVVEEGVLFGGDTIVTAIPPVFTDGHSTILERTARRLADLDLQALVPGHGRVVRGGSDVRATILGVADHLADTRERVYALFGPHGPDEVVARLPLQDASRFDAGLVPVPELSVRHERMVRALIGEVGMRPVVATGT
jgi:glyoxylase-like metal-dependent hydrolase (beta-lactamase superfamily II)